MSKKFRIELKEDSYDLLNNHRMIFLAEEQEEQEDLPPFEQNFLAALFDPPKDPEVREAYFAAKQQLTYCETAIEDMLECQNRFKLVFNTSSSNIYYDVDQTMRDFISDADFLYMFVRESSGFVPIADELDECSNFYSIHKIARECADNIASAFEAYTKYVLLQIHDKSILNEFNTNLISAEGAIKASIGIMLALARKTNMFIPPEATMALFDFSATREIAKAMDLSPDKFESTPDNQPG